MGNALFSGPAIIAAQGATKTHSIIFFTGVQPVRSGLSRA
jgi:hypothetical protein